MVREQPVAVVVASLRCEVKVAKAILMICNYVMYRYRQGLICWIDYRYTYKIYNKLQGNFDLFSLRYPVHCLF